MTDKRIDEIRLIADRICELQNKMLEIDGGETEDLTVQAADMAVAAKFAIRELLAETTRLRDVLGGTDRRMRERPMTADMAYVFGLGVPGVDPRLMGP